MHLEYTPVKGQKFEIGRTINPANCDCEVCAFLNCPKKNYAVKMTRKKYTVDVFWNQWKDEILKLNHPRRWQYSFHDEYNLRLTFDMISDFFDILCFAFPKGLYWSHENPENYDDGDIGSMVYKDVGLVKFSRSGKEIRLGRIRIANHEIYDYDLSERQYKLAEKVSGALRLVKEKVFEYYQEKDKDWLVGWLARDGRHYPCGHCEHITLAQYLGGDELHLESTGWIKVALHDEDGYFGNRDRMSAEQRNWLSLNGYYLEDAYEENHRH